MRIAHSHSAHTNENQYFIDFSVVICLWSVTKARVILIRTMFVVAHWELWSCSLRSNYQFSLQMWRLTHSYIYPTLNSKVQSFTSHGPRYFDDFQKSKLIFRIRIWLPRMQRRLRQLSFIQGKIWNHSFRHSAADGDNISNGICGICQAPPRIADVELMPHDKKNAKPHMESNRAKGSRQ